MAVRRFTPLAALAVASLALAACQDGFANIPKNIRPLPDQLVIRMAKEDMKETAPVLVRLFKEESALEVWKRTRDGKYVLLKTYAICKWSGVLGPKIKEGDRQAPEGFYSVAPAQMNPDSKYYLAFNIGFPNAFDRSLGRTGSNLMVHGACSSAGCYSMTDADAGELYALARDAFLGGQTEFLVQAFPFRMTPENLARHRDSPHLAFWRMLKIGYDHFEVTRQAPKIDVCDKSYVFNADAGDASFKASAACPAYTVPADIASAVAAKQAADEKKFTLAVLKFEAGDKKAAEDAAVAAEKAAVAAVRPKRPSIFALWTGRGTATPAPEPLAPGVAPPLPRTAPATGAVLVAPLAVAAVPTPRVKPKPKPVTAAVMKIGTPEPEVVPVKTAPMPEPEPLAIAPNPVAPVAAAPPAALEPDSEPPPVETATNAGPVAPTVGTIVKRKFLWPEDDAPSAAAPVPEPLPSATE